MLLSRASSANDLGAAHVETQALQVEAIADLEALGRLDWDSLVEHIGEDLPTMLHGFLVPWYVHAAPPYTPRALAVWQGRRLVGLAPFASRTISKLGIACRVLGFPMRGATPPFAVLADGGSTTVAAALARHLRSDRSWDLVLLHNVRVPSPAVDSLCVEARRAGLHVERRRVAETFVVHMDATWEEFLRKRPKKVRNNTRRNWRNCENLGATRMLTYPGDIADVGAALSLVAQILPNTWKSLDDATSLDDHFLGACARALDRRGHLGLRFLTIGGKAVAYMFEIRFRSEWYLLHCAFDASFQRVGAGQVVLSETLKAAHEAGARAVDFLGDSEYLSRWTDDTRAVDEVQILNRSPLSRLKARVYSRVHAARREAARAESAARREAVKRQARADGEAAP